MQHVFSVSSAEHHAGALATGTHDGVLRSLERNGVAIVRGATVQPPLVTELRDVFHTLVDAAGLGAAAAARPPAFAARDGKSLP